MTDLGSLNWFLGMSFVSRESSIEVNQTKYIEKVLDRFNMLDCQPKNIPCDPSMANMSNVESCAVWSKVGLSPRLTHCYAFKR